MKLKDNDANVKVLSEREIIIDGGRVQVRVAPVLDSDIEKEVFITWNYVVNS